MKLHPAVIARIVDEAVSFYLETGDSRATKKMVEAEIARELLRLFAPR